jgi:long-chain acyl-CoA synthetase
MTVDTVAGRIAGWAERTPGGVALREKRLGIWRDITWADYWEHVQLIAHGLTALGVTAGERVAIHSENRPEWLFADAGAVSARAIPLGLYPTNPAAEVRYLLADSGAMVLIAEDQEQVDKALAVKADLPGLRWIVYIEPRGVRDYDDPSLVWWPDLLERGRTHRREHPGLVEQLAAEVREDDVATLVYTSGTTGPPKGAMLTVGNINFAIDVLAARGALFPDACPDDLTISYLPLAHVADRLGSAWCNAHAGNQVHFAESIETVGLSLREVQPTLFLAVPRIWEKLRATVEVRMASASRLKRLN